MEKIAIIGMGISGMAVASAYAKEVDPGNIEIHCYDSEESFGRGFPFREDSDQILINLNKEKISFDYENLKDFKDWLDKKGYSYGRYVPRHIFGLYTRDRLKGTMKKIDAKKITSIVKRLEWNKYKNKWELETDSGYIEYFDRVHLCCGELPQMDPFNLASYDKYIDPIYPSNQMLKSINHEDRVAIIGTSLAAVDITRYLLIEKDVKRIYMFSRSNIIPTLRLKPKDLDLNIITYETCLDIIESGNGIISFEKFDELFNKELGFHGLIFNKLMEKYTPGVKSLKKSIKEEEDLAKIQGIFSQLTLILNLVWSAFSLTDREKFNDKYEDFIQAFGNPLPIPTGKILLDAIDSNRLIVLDKVSDIIYRDEEEAFHLQEYSEDSTSIIAKVDFVCNATGLDLSLKTLSKEDTLIGKMIDHRYLQVDNSGGITVIPENIRVMSPKLGEFKTLHAHGVLIAGVQLRNNSTSVIQRTAHELIKEIYK